MKFIKYRLRAKSNNLTTFSAVDYCNNELDEQGKGIFFEDEPASAQTIAENDAYRHLLACDPHIQNDIQIDITEGEL
jgi:hypothetical protein